MLIASVRRPDGAWVRRAEYPELPGCVAEADSPLDAIDQLDALRERFILGRLARGEPVPVPRPPLARLPRAGPPAEARPSPNGHAAEGVN
jgi:predicted RNase H-like HicB family nuclease